MKKVYVLTNAELGWDCVMGVYDAAHVTPEEIAKAHAGEGADYTDMNPYFLFEQALEIDV